MLPGTKHLVPLLVLLSVSQDVMALPGLFTKKEVDPIFGYEIKRPGPFGIKGLTIYSRMNEEKDGYIANAEYVTEKNRKLDATVVCRKGQSDYFPFNLYHTLYSGDYNISKDDSPTRPFYHAIRRFFSKKGDECYMIAMPECNHSFFYHIANGFASLQIALSIFSENIKIARDMKAKGWMIGDAIDNGGCITNNHMVFAKYKYVRSIKQLTSEQGSDSLIIKANEDMWSNLSRLYTIIYSRSRAETLQHFKDNYSDLLLPTRNPPNYDYLSDDQLSSNSRRGLFSSGSMSPPSYPQRINSMDSGSDPLPLYEPRQSSDSTN